MGFVIPKLVDLRDEWAVQILVLFSFSLQVFLRLFAWIRRDSSSTVARALLWLAYLLADSTAVFTLGHLSISSKLPERHQLVAFWAPFLLVHLGGQDTITAYSFEDNRLWLRHLQTLVVQVLGAAYVLYKYMPIGDVSELMAAALLIFVVGILKYGERIWALRSATFSSIWRSLDTLAIASSLDIITTSSSDATANPLVRFRKFVKTTYQRMLRTITDDEQVAVRGKPVDAERAQEGAGNKLVDAERAQGAAGNKLVDAERAQGGAGNKLVDTERAQGDATARNKLKLVDAERAQGGVLSNIKRVVVEGPLGGARNKLVDANAEDGEALLMGAHGLFIVCKGLFIGMKGGQLDSMQEVLSSFEKRGRLTQLMEMELSLMYDILYTKAAVIHTWYGCCIRIVSLLATAAALLLFQLSLISSSKQYDRRKADVTVTYVLLAGALLLEVVSVVSAAGSTWTRVLLHDSQLRPLHKWRRLDVLILQLRSVIGALSHRRWSGSLGQYNLLESCARDASREPNLVEKAARSLGLGWAVEFWFGHGHWRQFKILYSTTEVVLRKVMEMGKRGEGMGSLPSLLTLQRLQLVDHVGWNIQDMEIEDSVMAWHMASMICVFAAANSNRENDDDVDKEDLREAVTVLSNYMMFLLVIQPYMLPGPVRHSHYIQARDELRWTMKQAPPATSSPEGRLRWALAKGLHAHSNSYANFNDNSYDTPKLHDTAVRLANALHHRSDGMEVIFGVWVEMLCYVANNCSTESHARQLSNGGEFVTIVWLMARHANLSYASS